MNKFEVRKATLDLLGGNSSNCSNIYEVDLEILKIYEEGGGGSTGSGGKAKVKKIVINNNCIVDGKWNANAIDTSLLTTMHQMFWSCSSLIELDLSGWNTSNVTSISNMFLGCSSLQSVDGLSDWDTSNVTNMSSLFESCSSLIELDLSGWNTSNVTNISYMFRRCKILQNLNLSGWNTSNVTNMSNIFYNANINNLDITGWTDVSNVTSIVSFCSSSTNIPSFIGGRTIDDVINNNITILNGLKIASSNYLLGRYADRASVRALINGLADLTGQSTVTLNLTSTEVIDRLTDEDIAIATAKNWTIA